MVGIASQFLIPSPAFRRLPTLPLLRLLHSSFPLQHCLLRQRCPRLLRPPCPRLLLQLHPLHRPRFLLRRRHHSSPEGGSSESRSVFQCATNIKLSMPACY